MIEDAEVVLPKFVCMHTTPGYLFHSDEAYEIKKPFYEVVDLVREKSIEEDYPLGKDILLVIQTSEGVFLRSKSSEWCEYFTSLAYRKDPDLGVRILEKGEWDTLTRKLKAPINSFGDERLAIWKIGF
jgi:hypothetical protein